MIPKHVKIGLVVLFTVVILGVIGMMIIESLSLVDAIYFAFIPITTLPTTSIGKLFKSFMTLALYGSFVYLFGAVVESATKGEFLKIFQKNVPKEIEKLSGHYIIIGFGEVGSSAAEYLKSQKVPIAVVERHEVVVRKCLENDILAIQGNAREKGKLSAAGIERAKAVIITPDDDAENIVLTLAVRAIRPDIKIIARCGHTKNIEGLKLAGATKILVPEVIAGEHFGKAAIRD